MKLYEVLHLWHVWSSTSSKQNWYKEINRCRRDICKVLNINKEIITPFLTDICYQVLKYGVYLEVLKVAKVIPIHKSGKKTDSSNYWPISVLSHLNKIVEQVIHKRLIYFFHRYNILNENQFGFKKKFSTNLALLDLHEQLLQNKENVLSTVPVFLDLKGCYRFGSNLRLLSTEFVTRDVVQNIIFIVRGQRSAVLTNLSCRCRT